MHIVTQGLILREVAYKDADKILTVLTRDGGKLTVKARGCRKKGSRLAAAAQLLVYSDMTLFEYKDYWSLDEADSIEQFWGVRSDLDLLSLGSYFAEVMEAVADEGRADPPLLSLILNSLYALDQLKKPQELVKAVFELKLLALAGYEPLLDACAVCGVPDPAEPRFHVLEGVLHCAGCKVGTGTSLSLDKGSLAAMRHILYGDPKRIFSFALDVSAQDRLEKACERFLTTQFDRGFRTLDFYKQIRQISPPPRVGEV